MAETKTGSRAAAVAAQMAGLAKAAPAITEPAEQAPPRERKQAAPRDRAAAPMPAETQKTGIYSKRIPLMTTPEMHRALVQARTDDGIEATARIRAMITLWQSDDRLRARVDKLAKSLRK
jgi:hypothetical protein